MIGVVECGSTKAEWQFTDETKKVHSNRTNGFSPTYQSEEEIYETLKNELIPVVPFKEEIRKIYFYGTGCEAEVGKAKVRSAILKVFPKAEIWVMHDLMAAAKALFGDKAGIVCIAGTGSNTCHYDGSHIVKNVDSLGVFLGDEGSGGYKGKQLLAMYMRKELSPRLIKAFEAEYPDRRDDIIQKIYNGPMPSRYIASFAPFLMQHRQEPEIYKLIYQSFSALFENCVMKYDNVKELPVGFVGSIAYHFKDILEEVAENKGLKISVIDPNPSEALLKYHLEKEFKK